MNVTLICPACGSPLTDTQNPVQIVCGNCSHVFPFWNGIPIFSVLDSPRRSASVMESTFKHPTRYQKLVNVKRLIYKDKVLGIEDYMNGKDVLDVGCGPSLAFEHLEYSASLTRSLVGVDVSLPFVDSARRENPDDKFTFLVAQADRLPFPDKSFDTTIASYLLHHAAPEPSIVLKELLRVTKNHVIIFDHIKSAGPLRGVIQQLYWNIFDGGCHYQTKSQWDTTTGNLNVVRTLRTGAIFGHVYKFIIAIDPSAA
jgi:SAM-dependent methyltransferase